MERQPMRILVGVDFSASSEQAFERALELARGAGGRLDVVHVHSLAVNAPIELFDRFPEELAEAGQLRICDDTLLRMAEAPLAQGVPTSVHLRLGDPTMGLLAAIEELRPDLVVLGSRGRGVLARALLGSVSHEVWLASPVPVTIVRPHPAVRRAKAGPQRIELAWACTSCGHIHADGDPIRRCAACGMTPGKWIWAPLVHAPVDQQAPAVGRPFEESAGREDRPGASAPESVIPTAPAGVSGYAINPELRVRY
jgi:nucleotide-binding universal stress UspA family protein